MSKTTVIIVGTGSIARCHLQSMLQQTRTTDVVGLVEVSEKQRQATRDLYAERKLPCPPFYESIKELVAKQGAADASFVCTPHSFHLENTRDSLLCGMDVLLEKPMVISTAEARRLIDFRDKTGRLVVVAFPGSLSPAVKKAKQLLAQGKIGRVSAISAYVHQGWKQGTTGTWRQDPAISGGGFLFDTGSHLINTVVDLIGEDIADVTALQDNCGAPVEIRSSVSGRSRSGVLFSLTAAGDALHFGSDILVFGTAGVLQTASWGGHLNIKMAKDHDFKAVALPKSLGVWGQFMKVRAGQMENPCPPEIGLRFARLMDMIRKSAETGRTIRAGR